MYVISRMSRDGYLPWSNGMLEMSVTARRINILPTILLQYFDQVPYFHACLMPPYTTVNSGAPSFAYGQGLPFK